MMRLARTVPTLLLSLVAAAATVLAGERSAHAQVNAEALRSTLRSNPKFLWLDAGLTGRTGNTRTLTFSGGAFAGITGVRQVAFARVSADYGEASGVTNIARWMAHARYNYRFTPVLAVEALAQVQHDEFRRIGVRDLYGVGMRFNIVTEDDYEIFAGTTYLLEHERIEADDPYPSANELWNRSSSYVGANLHLTPLVDASTVTYFQPRWDKPSDFRLLSDTFVSFTISKLLSARVSGSLWYDNDPPGGVKTYDLEIKNTLTFKFQ